MALLGDSFRPRVLDDARYDVSELLRLALYDISDLVRCSRLIVEDSPSSKPKMPEGPRSRQANLPRKSP